MPLAIPTLDGPRGPSTQQDTPRASTAEIPLRAASPLVHRLRILTDGCGTQPRPGDLIFGRRLSVVQRLNTLSGDSLTHSGVIYDADGELRVAEHGARGPFSRSLENFEAAYPTVAILRPSMSETCRANVAAEAAQRSSGRTTYSWTTVGTIGLSSLARRVLPGRFESRAIDITARLAHRLFDRLPPTSVTCSSFVVTCLDAACRSCRPILVWPARPRVGPWRGMTTPTDARAGASRIVDIDGDLARRLVTPCDLWVGVPHDIKYVRQASHTTVIIDMSESGAEISHDLDSSCKNAPTRDLGLIGE